MTDPNAENDDEGPIVVQNVDQFPYVILKGDVANLSALRQGDMDVQATFFEQRRDAEEGEGVEPALLLEPSLQATVKTGEEGIAGEVFVTRSQVLFVAKDKDQAEHDLAIGASCIVLHAMMEEPQLAVALQLNESSSDKGFAFGNNPEEEETDENDDSGSGPLEAIIQPKEEQDCQRLFDSLCKLVSLHPMKDDEDDDGFIGGGGDGMMFGGGDDLIWAPAAASSTVSMDGSEGGGATETEREAMLERLDNLLVVRPELEIQEGQFDDADVEEGNGKLQ